MPAAVVHFVFSMLITRFFAKKFLKMTELRTISFVGGLAGVLPDADFIPFYLQKIFSLGLSLSTNHLLHRTVTHSVVFSLFFLILALLFYKKKNVFTILLIMSLGVTTHIALDFFTASNLVIFYPFSEMMTGMSLLPSTYYGTRMVVTLDAIVFLLWIGWLFYKKKITDFL